MFERIVELVDEVPAFERFAGVDELSDRIREIAALRPDLAEVERIGGSRQGEPLWSMTIRGGPKQVVVVGGVHPNEPVGGLTALHLARTLVTDDALREELGCTWHIVACVDPDGTRCNESWFEPPLTMPKYGRSFYRPAPDEQVEWTFPFTYKESVFDRVMPETQALMDLIDRTRPMLLCSLHNGEYGGAFYYLNDTGDGLNEQLAEIPTRLGIPLHTGEGEAAFIEQMAPAVFRSFTAEQEYDFLAEHGIDPTERTCGASSCDYASRYGTAYLATEVPYWANEDADDHSPLEQTYAELLRERAERTSHTAEVLTETLDAIHSDLSLRSPQLRAIESFLPFLVNSAETDRVRAGQSENERPAVVAERFLFTATTHSTRVRFAGMLLAALGEDLADGNTSAVLRSEHARLEEVFDQWASEAEAEVPPKTIAIRDLVGVQFGAILASTVHFGAGVDGSR